MSMPGETVILDACCTLNLAATGRMAQILERLPFRFCIGRRARGEAQWLRIPGEEERERVDLEPLLQLSLLVIEELQDAAEEALFVQFSEHIADGEAEAAALAILRSYVLATDDRKARRVVTAADRPVQLTGTLELIREWQDEAGIQETDMANVLRRIAERARYRPRRNHPLWDWWSRLMEG
jgi:predicted nucleic acid-binding protein